MACAAEGVVACATALEVESPFPVPLAPQERTSNAPPTTIPTPQMPRSHTCPTPRPHSATSARPGLFLLNRSFHALHILLAVSSTPCGLRSLTRSVFFIFGSPQTPAVTRVPPAPSWPYLFNEACSCFACS